MFGVHDIVTILLGKCAHRLNLIVCIVVVERSLRLNELMLSKRLTVKINKKSVRRLRLMNYCGGLFVGISNPLWKCQRSSVLLFLLLCVLLLLLSVAISPFFNMLCTSCRKCLMKPHTHSAWNNILLDLKCVCD